MLKPSDLLSQPNSWCQGAYAENALHRTVGSRDTDAVRWCAMGAIERVAIDREHQIEMTNKLKRHLFGDWITVTAWNDDMRRTREEVVQTFREIGL